jgi:hypothetical protein
MHLLIVEDEAGLFSFATRIRKKGILLAALLMESLFEKSKGKL